MRYKTIPEMIAAVAQHNADRTAIVDRGKAVTYSNLETRIVSLASELQSLGVRRGDRVAVLLPNSFEFVASYFAITAIGAIVVPLNDSYQQNEFRYFLDVCDVSVVITSTDHAELYHQVQATREAPCKAYFLEQGSDTLVSGGSISQSLRSETDPDAPVMFQFSSGSTGRPKQIARTHHNLITELDSLHQTLAITNQDRFLGAAPFSHVNGLMRSMMACISAGATLYTVSKFDRRVVAQLIQQHRISVFIAVPFMFSMLAKAHFRHRPDFSSLRLCVSASAPMPKRQNEQFFETFGIYVRQLYGSTETGTISVNMTSHVASSLESVGLPLAGVAVEIFTEDGRLAAVNEMGEIAVKSPFAITGYVSLDDVNKEVFRNGHFFTGDLGHKDADGLIYLIGRKKFFINKGGYKINPQDIEEVIETHPCVEEVVAVGVSTAYGDEKVKAVVVLKDGCTEEDLIEHCRGKIADFKIPSVVEFRDSLPKSPTGKIRRKMLV